MHVRSLTHIVEVVRALVHPTQIIVLGSSSLLARHATLGEEGHPLELSLDADLLIEPSDEATAAIVHEAVGEGSLFHREYGVFAELLRPEIGETFPPGWFERCVPLEGDEDVRCLDPYDLAVAKLALAREKDLELLRALVAAGILDVDTIVDRYRDMPMDEPTMFRAGRALAALRSDPC